MHICSQEIFGLLMGISMGWGALVVLRAKFSQWRTKRRGARSTNE